MHHIAANYKLNADDDHPQLKCTVDMHFAAWSYVAPQHVNCAVFETPEGILVMVMVYCIP